MVLGIGEGPTLSLKIMSLRRVTGGHERLEWRQELAERRWAVLTYLLLLSALTTLPSGSSGGLRGTLCKLLFMVWNQNWLHGRATWAVARVPALGSALCCRSLEILNTFGAQGSAFPLWVRSHSILPADYIAGPASQGWPLRFQEDRTSVLLSCWWHV